MINIIILLPKTIKCGPSNIAVSISDLFSERYNTEVVSLYKDYKNMTNKYYNIEVLSKNKFSIYSQISNLIKKTSSNKSIINTHGIRPLLVSAIARLFSKNINIVHSQHIYDKEDLFKRHSFIKSLFFLMIRKFIFLIPDIIVVESNSQNKKYNDDKIKTKIIYNFVKYYPLEYSKNPNMINIHFLAHFIPLKQPQLLINAFLKAKQQHLMLNLFGDGVLLEESKKLLHGSMLNYNFFGNIPNASKKYFNLGDIFVLPSLQEGMSIAVIEAMSRGCIIVLSEIDGNIEFKEIFQSKGLIYFNTEDELIAILKNLSLLNSVERESYGLDIYEKSKKYLSEDSVKFLWEDTIESF